MCVCAHAHLFWLISFYLWLILVFLFTMDLHLYNTIRSDTTRHNKIDIIFTKDEICTLTDIVITHPTHMNLLPWYCTIQNKFTSNTTQIKEKRYYNWQLTNQFFLLVIEIFRCLHKQSHVFLYDYTNVNWSFQKLEGEVSYMIIPMPIGTSKS